MGDDTAHWEGLGRIPPQVGLQADGKTTSESTVRWMVLSPAGGNYVKGGFTGCGDQFLPLLEQTCTVHCDQAHYVPVPGGGTEDGVNSGQAVVLVVLVETGGDADGSSGGETDGGGGSRRTGWRRIKFLGTIL